MYDINTQLRRYHEGEAAQYKQMREMSWYVAALQRMKKMPTFDKWVTPPEAPSKSDAKRMQGDMRKIAGEQGLHIVE